MRKIALVLSGGGFRATLFHLGVVRLLHLQGRLRDVSLISSVSGGSILAAHMVMNWDSYTGSSSAFQRATEEVIAFARRDVRGRIQRWWLASALAVVPRVLAWFGESRQLTSPFTLTGLLISQYERLYRGLTLGQLASRTRNGRNRPEVYLNCVSMTTGRHAAFDSRGLWIDGRSSVIQSPRLSVSFAVAASSAFPPMFPPLRVDYLALGVSPDLFTRPQYLADGGILDNLGIHRILALLNEGGESFESVILSDAGARLKSNLDSTFISPVWRNVRAADLMGARISELVRQAFDDERLGTIRLLSVYDEVNVQDVPWALDPQLQRRVALVRTDLDRFSNEEVQCLIRHGESVASLKLANDPPGSSRSMATAFTGTPLRPSGLKDMLLDAGRRRWRIVAPAHAAFWVVVVLLVGWLYLGWGLVITPRIDAWHLGRDRGAVAQMGKAISSGEVRQIKVTVDELEPGWRWLPLPVRRLWGRVIETPEISRSKTEFRKFEESGSASFLTVEARARTLSRAYANGWVTLSEKYAPESLRVVQIDVHQRLRESVTRMLATIEIGMAPRSRSDSAALLGIYWGEGGILQRESTGKALDALSKELLEGGVVEDDKIRALGSTLLDEVNKATGQPGHRSLAVWTYCFESPDETPPGKRVWARMSDDTWIEMFPHGAFQILPVLGRGEVDGCSGTRVYRLSDRALARQQNELFIPDTTRGPACSLISGESLLYRPHGGSEWNFVARIGELRETVENVPDNRPFESGLQPRVMVMAGLRGANRREYTDDSVLAAEVENRLRRDGVIPVRIGWNNMVGQGDAVLANTCEIRSLATDHKADAVLAVWAAVRPRNTGFSRHGEAAHGGIQLYRNGKRIRSRQLGQQGAMETSATVALERLRSALGEAAAAILEDARRQ